MLRYRIDSRGKLAYYDQQMPPGKDHMNQARRPQKYVGEGNQVSDVRSPNT